MTPTSTTPKSDAKRDRLLDAVPPVAALTRLRQVAFQQAKELWFGTLEAVPGLKRLDRPRRQPLRSGSLALNTWWRKSYGSPDKPSSLWEIPWDYVCENEDIIPFTGLREYWYPAAESADVPHNRPVPITLVGDNVVLFRDGEGAGPWKTGAPTEGRCFRSVRWVSGNPGCSPADTTA